MLEVIGASARCAEVEAETIDGHDLEIALQRLAGRAQGTLETATRATTIWAIEGDVVVSVARDLSVRLDWFRWP
jgi:hypothetical protein